MQLEDFKELGVVLPIREKKERTELQKINDAKTSQRMKEWHQKRRQEKAKKKEIRDVVLAEEKDDDKIIVKFYDLEEEPKDKEEPKILMLDERASIAIPAEDKLESLVKNIINKIEKKEKLKTKVEHKPITVKKNFIECFDDYS
jgi:hypothetical protein